jgi:hypothetical protein
MQPDPASILEILSIDEPVVGIYDAPDPERFAPLVQPTKRDCVFASREQWRQGLTLHLTRERHGCGARQLLDVNERTQEQMVAFLCDQEGLKASHELMDRWLESTANYQPRHGHLLVGPLRPDEYQYLRAASFYVNPDQLAVLCAGAVYYHAVGETEPVIAPFGSGCMQILSLFGDLDAPQAIIGSLDQAMRKHLEPWMLTFTATKPMFERLCRWADDPRSSLHTGFLRDLLAARGGSLRQRSPS